MNKRMLNNLYGKVVIGEMFPDPKHNKLLATFMTCEEYETFKGFLRDMELHEFIDGHIVTEGGEDMIEVIIYKEVK